VIGLARASRNGSHLAQTEKQRVPIAERNFENIACAFHNFEKTGNQRKIFQKLIGSGRTIFQKTNWNSTNDLPEKNWNSMRDLPEKK
jgi:hypothetical protein